MKKMGSIFKTLGSSGTLLIVISVMVTFLLAIVPSSFGTYTNFNNLLRQTSINGIVALGMTIVIITGGIDLSVGAVVAFSGVTMALLTVNYNVPLPIAIAAAAVASTFLGLINGMVVYDAKIPPFIATMGMMTIIRGWVKLSTGARMISGIPDAFVQISQTNILAIPVLFWVWLFFIVASVIFLKYTVFGRNIYAVGSSYEVARLSGINIRFQIYLAYSCSAFAAGVAGILLVSRLGAGIPTAGVMYELDAIAASVIGGASLSGAEGTPIGTVLGAFIMQILRNGGTLLGVDSFVLEIIIGFLIVLSVFFDQLRKSRQ